MDEPRPLTPRVTDEEVTRITLHEKMEGATGRGSIIPNLAMDLRDARAEVVSLRKEKAEARTRMLADEERAKLTGDALFAEGESYDLRATLDAARAEVVALREANERRDVLDPGWEAWHLCPRGDGFVVRKYPSLACSMHQQGGISVVGEVGDLQRWAALAATPSPDAGATVTLDHTQERMWCNAILPEGPDPIYRITSRVIAQRGATPSPAVPVEALFSRDTFGWAHCLVCGMALVAPDIAMLDAVGHSSTCILSPEAQAFVTAAAQRAKEGA